MRVVYFCLHPKITQMITIFIDLGIVNGITGGLVVLTVRGAVLIF